MQSVNDDRTRAIKLREVLGAMGYPLSPSQCLDVVSGIDSQTIGKSKAAAASDGRIVAEQYLDKIVEAFAEQSYAKVTQFTEDKYLVNFSERKFKRDVMHSHEDLGDYVRREFMGSLKSESHADEPEKFPDHVRYVWRGIFKKSDMLLILGLYLKNETYYVSDISGK